MLAKLAVLELAMLELAVAVAVATHPVAASVGHLVSSIRRRCCGGTSSQHRPEASRTPCTVASSIHSTMTCQIYCDGLNHITPVDKITLMSIIQNVNYI